MDSKNTNLRGQRQLHAHAFVVGSIVFSPIIGFCWRLMLISFYFLYYYAVFFYSFLLDIPWAQSHLLQYTVKAFLHHVALAGLVLWCISITPIHVIAPTLIDLWTPYTVHPALRTTEIMYDARSNAVVDIFAIHGLGSNPDSAWSYRMGNDTKVYWLRDLLPTIEGLQDIRVVLVNHQTRWDADTASLGLQDHASELLDHIESVHKAHPRRPIIFIAHSFGGILLKKALLLAKARSKDVADMTKGIIFLGVPHRGTQAAFFASCLSCMAFFRGSSTDLLELMTVDGPELLSLESEFYSAYVVQYHSQNVQPYIYDILEKRPEKIGKLVLGSIVRPKQGQLRHGRLLTLDTDHRGLNKFQSHDDPNFQIFLGVFWQIYDHALKNSIPPEKLFPPLAGPITELVAQPAEKNAMIHTLYDLLANGVFGMPWETMNKPTAAVLYGLDEVTASWLAKDRNEHGRYLTIRVPRMALYGAIVHVPLCSVLKSLLHEALNYCTSLSSQGLHLLVINLLIASLLDIIHISATAVIAGDHAYHQVHATVCVGFWHMMYALWVLLPIGLAFWYLYLPRSALVPVCDLVTFLAGTYTNTVIKKRRLAIRKKPSIGNDNSSDNSNGGDDNSKSNCYINSAIGCRH